MGCAACSDIAPRGQEEDNTRPLDPTGRNNTNAAGGKTNDFVAR
jgi:hypothetical protein